jgi:hypothetical protein
VVVAATSSVEASAVTAVFGFVGVILGLLANSIKERRLDRRVRLGVARALAKTLGDFDERLSRVAKDVCHSVEDPPSNPWWEEGGEADWTIPWDDLKYVAAEAKPEQWRDIDYALTHVRAIRERRTAKKAPSEVSNELADALIQIEKGIKTLNQMTGADAVLKEGQLPWREQLGVDAACLSKLKAPKGGGTAFTSP